MVDNMTQDSVLVDVVIAVHTPNRPIERAVSSLMAGGLPTELGMAGRLRVTVVCHNTDIGPIRERVAPEYRERVRFVRLSDGSNSPAGPFNHGIALATAPWVSIMGSDDSVEPGAIGDWLRTAMNDRADVLIAPMAHAGGPSIHTPVVRRLRRSALDPNADRLAYRTAPLGLMRLKLIRDLGLLLDARYATGEDQIFSARLWFSHAKISYGRGLPRYLVHGDAVSRVTSTPRSVTDDLAFATDLVESDWFDGLDPAQRATLVTKLIRVHVFSHVMLRAELGTWDATDALAMATVSRRLLFAAPNAARPLSVADRALLDAVARSESNVDVMKSLTTLRRTFSNPRTWLPRDISRVFHPEAPLRFMIASALVS